MGCGASRSDTLAAANRVASTSTTGGQAAKENSTATPVTTPAPAATPAAAAARRPPAPSNAAPKAPVATAPGLEVKIDAKPSLRVRRLGPCAISFMVPQAPWKPEIEMPPEFARHKDVLTARGAGLAEAAAFFRELTCAPSTPVHAMCEGSSASVVKALLDVVAAPQGQYADGVKEDALWALANICAGSHADAVFISDLSAVDILLKILVSAAPAGSDPAAPPPAGASSRLLQELSLLALGNLAGSRDRDNSTLPIAAEIIDYDGIRTVVRTLRSAVDKYLQDAATASTPAANPGLGLLRASIWCLCNLARQRSTKETLEAIPVLTKILLDVSDVEVLAASCQVLDWLAEEPENVLDLRGCLEVLPKLVLWTRDASTCLCTPSLRTLGALCTGFSGELGLGSVDYCQEVVSSGGVEAMLSFLKKARSRSDFEQQREALFALSNVAGASNLAVKALMDEGVFHDVLELMRQSKEEQLRTECLYVIANPWAPTVGVEADVAKQLLKEGLLHELTSMCDAALPPKLLRLVLTGLQDGLKKGQQLMMWAAKAQELAVAMALSQGLPAPPIPANMQQNAVSQLYRELGTVAKVQALNGHADEEVATKANGLSMQFKFL